MNKLDERAFDRLLLDRVSDIETVLNQLKDPETVEAVEQIAGEIEDTIRGGHKLLFFGNGGSAADAGHIAAEFVGRCVHESDPLPALSLTDSPAILTALANDYGYEQVFARQVRALARPGDMVFGLSGSGRSANVLAGLKQARELGLRTIALTGTTGGQMDAVADVVMRAPSDVIGRIQEVHKIWGHLWAEWVEIRLFG
ncbi:MAG: D-sedoheptulose-7-phosphate isomerase [Candidatus Nanopelagicales bacterium]